MVWELDKYTPPESFDVKPTQPASMAVRVFVNGVESQLAIWENVAKGVRTDLLVVNPPHFLKPKDDWQLDLRTGKNGGGILDIAVGLRPRILAHIRVHTKAKAIQAEDITIL